MTAAPTKDLTYDPYQALSSDMSPERAISIAILVIVLIILVFVLVGVLT